jgi:hypothetical protein
MKSVSASRSCRHSRESGNPVIPTRIEYRVCVGVDPREGACERIGIASSVMAGLDPAIHKLLTSQIISLDGRLKGGHDDEGEGGGGTTKIGRVQINAPCFSDSNQALAGWRALKRGRRSQP